MLFVVCCKALIAVCCGLSLFAVCCLLSSLLLFVVCCVLRVVCCALLLFVRRVSCVVRCVLSVVVPRRWLLFAVSVWSWACQLYAECCLLFVAVGCCCGLLVVACYS